MKNPFDERWSVPPYVWAWRQRVKRRLSSNDPVAYDPDTRAVSWPPPPASRPVCVCGKRQLTIESFNNGWARIRCWACNRHFTDWKLPPTGDNLAALQAAAIFEDVQKDHAMDKYANPYNASFEAMPENVQEAISDIVTFGMVDGAHHKQWLLDRALRHLMGEGEYEEWRARFDLEMARTGYGIWDQGIAP